VLPSEPVRILGFKTLPKAGDPVVCVDSEAKAEKLIQRRAALGGVEGSARTDDDGPSSLQIMGVAAQHRKLQIIHDKYNIDMHAVDNRIRIPVVLRADADGTLAALCDAIVAIGIESSLDIVIDPIGLGIGPISAADVKLAKDSNAAIFSFNVKQNDKEALALLEDNGVIMKSSKVIYTILDAAKEVFASYIPSTSVTHVHGKAVVKAIFEVNNSSERDRIAGLRVTQGHLFREKASLEGKPIECHFRVIRDGEQISPKGEVIRASSMRKVKEDVQEVRNGEECGLGLNGFKDFEEGDIIECYSVEMKTVVL
jgi:translation initiation factor IF-2